MRFKNLKELKKVVYPLQRTIESLDILDRKIQCRTNRKTAVISIDLKDYIEHGEDLYIESTKQFYKDLVDATKNNKQYLDVEPEEIVETKFRSNSYVSDSEIDEIVLTKDIRPLGYLNIDSELAKKIRDSLKKNNTTTQLYISGKKMYLQQRTRWSESEEPEFLLNSEYPGTYKVVSERKYRRVMSMQTDETILDILASNKNNGAGCYILVDDQIDLVFVVWKIRNYLDSKNYINIEAKTRGSWIPDENNPDQYYGEDILFNPETNRWGYISKSYYKFSEETGGWVDVDIEA